jgi:hypothetical protein
VFEVKLDLSSVLVSLKRGLPELTIQSFASTFIPTVAKLKGMMVLSSAGRCRCLAVALRTMEGLVSPRFY